MSEPSEPVITLEMFQERQDRITEALDACLCNLHVKYAVTSGEALAGLAAVSHAVAITQAMAYWEIKAPVDVEYGTGSLTTGDGR